MKRFILLAIIIACDVFSLPDPRPCGAGEPCTTDDDCAPGLVCPTEEAPLLGYVGECVAPCSVGCCGDGSWCDVEDGVGVCVDQAGAPGCPSSTTTCWP